VQITIAESWRCREEEESKCDEGREFGMVVLLGRWVKGASGCEGSHCFGLALQLIARCRHVSNGLNAQGMQATLTEEQENASLRQ
jgi:hypothetical protein